MQTSIGKAYIYWPRETEMIYKLISLYIVFSHATVVIRGHKINSTPAKQLRNSIYMFNINPSKTANQQLSWYLKLSYMSIAFVIALSSYVVRVQKVTPFLSKCCRKREKWNCTITIKEISKSKPTVPKIYLRKTRM